MRTRHLVTFVIFVALASAGCGTEPDNPPNVALLPVNNTPERAVQRLIATYENKRDAEFAGLFTEDYRYQFSNATDPDLVLKYASGWFNTDEEASAQHLFHGGNNQAGEYQPAATSIDVNFASTAPTGDLGQSDTIHFKVLFTRVDGTIIVPTSPDPTSYIIENNQNRFFLVRGDSARALGSYAACRQYALVCLSLGR